MTRQQLILPTAELVDAYDRKLSAVANVLLNDTLKPYEPIYTAMQYLEYDDKDVIITYADKMFDRALDITDNRATASTISQAVFEFGNGYHRTLTRLGLYEEAQRNGEKRFFPYYFGGNLNGDIVVRPYT